MSKDFSDSFDIYSAGTEITAFGRWTASAANFSFSTTTPYGTGRSITGPTTTQTLTSVTWTNRTTQRFACHVNRQNTSTFSISLRDGTSAQVSFVFEGGSTFTVRSGGAGGTVLSTQTLASVNAWAHINVEVTINNTTGSVKVWFNGAPEGSPNIDITNVNTRGGTATNQVNNMFVTFPATTLSPFFKDVFVWNNDGTAPTDWIGQPRCYSSPAAGAGNSTQFPTRVGAASNWAANSQIAPHDGDTSYVSSSTVGHTDLYTLTALPASPTNIYGLDHFVIWRKEDAGARTGALRRRSSTGGVEGNVLTNASLSTTYVVSSFWETTNPDGGAWTPTTLPQLGPRIEA